MTYVRVTRDQRGYENTFLLHSPRPGERPRVIYWYRSAPGVRVGRAALDEDAIRAIEDQHPEIEFDWPTLLEEATTTTPEVERRPERRRRPAKPREADGEETFAPDPVVAEPPVAVALAVDQDVRPDTPPAPPPPAADEPANPLLDQLVGREIARRLRSRYAELSGRIAETVEDEARQRALLARADALNPDRWVTVEAVLHGVEHADHLLDELRRDL